MRIATSMDAIASCGSLVSDMGWRNEFDVWSEINRVEWPAYFTWRIKTLFFRRTVGQMLKHIHQKKSAGRFLEPAQNMLRRHFSEGVTPKRRVATPYKF
jgi:hypothetical protein